MATVECKLSWVPASNGNFPLNAVYADGRCVIIRALHEGRWIPGKCIVDHSTAAIAHEGREIEKHEYEVLTVTSCREGHKCYSWQHASNGNIPYGAVLAGVDSDGESLYVARAVVEGEICGAKLKSSHRCAYAPWDGKEYPVKQYDVLCLKI